ncbi:unnamed protein product [Alopecurus aequalis]
MASSLRKLSVPFLLLILFLFFLLSQTTFTILPPSPLISENVNATTNSTTVDVSMDETMPSFHISPSPPPAPPVNTSRDKKETSLRLVKLLLRKTPRTRQFAERAADLFEQQQRPCTHRFFMTWLSPLQFGRREPLVIETLFRWHPDACLLIASHSMDSAGGTDRLRPFLDRGFRIAAASPDMAYLLDGTPAEGWLDKVSRGEVSPGSIPFGQNLSNLLRLALLYRYGGVYMDADVVILRPLTGLRNAIGAQAVDAATGDWILLNNAVLVFDQGHPMLREFIAEFTATFNGDKWGHNGPDMVSRVADRVRHQMPELGVTVLPPKAFYPVDWMNVGVLFVAPKDGNGKMWVKAKMDEIKGESFGIHLWNKESKSLQMVDGSVIGGLISQGCLFCNFSTGL